MEALFPCFSSSTTMRTEPEPRSTAQPIAYRGEAEEAVGIHPLAQCHIRNILVYPINELSTQSTFFREVYGAHTEGLDGAHCMLPYGPLQ